MTDNLYVLDAWVRIRIDELHAAAARARLITAAPPRAPRARRALAAVAGLIRSRGRAATWLAVGQPPR